MNYVIFTLSVLISVAVYLRVAKVYRIYDIPNERSSHRSRVIRGLGIVFVPAMLLAWFQIGFEAYWLAIAVLIGSITGFIDDLGEIPRSIRLLLYLAAVVATMHSIGLLSGHVSIWTLAVALVLTLGTVNAYNFMDGINGISVLYGLVCLIFGYSLELFTERSLLDSELILAAIITTAAFGLFNVRPKAKAFIGDAGSISLGIFCAYVVISLIVRTGDPIFVLMLGVYGVDSAGTILFRLLRHENIFEPHRLHIYQKLANERRKGHLPVAIGYAFLQMLINLVVFNRIEYSWQENLAIGLGILLSLILAYVLLRKYYLKDLRFSPK